MEKVLNDLKVGQKGKVTRIGGIGKIKRRLYDMGVTPDAEILVQKVAPLGDPIQITLRGYELSLRRSEAEQVMLEVK